MCPLYITSLPLRFWYPHWCNMSEMFSTVTGVKGVASPSLPIIAATLPIRHSTSCPMVMRDGMA